MFKTFKSRRLIFVENKDHMSNKIIALFMVMLALPVFYAFQPFPNNTTEEEEFVQAASKYYQSVLDELGTVPGVSVAIVKGDKPIMVTGFGQQKISGNKQVDEHTNFYIASCTKSFTALLALKLDQKGILSLDDPVTKHLPGVQFVSELEADKIKLRDLLNHTSGMRNESISFRLAYSGEHTLPQLIHLLDFTEPNEAGRGNYEYTNFGYNLYTIILDKITGKPWQIWLEEEIFNPAGLNRTTAFMSKVQSNGWELATPHLGIYGKSIEEVYLIKNDKNMQSAGGLITNAANAAKWINLQMNQGQLNGKQIFPSKLIEASQLPSTKTDEKKTLFRPQEYGLGWGRSKFEGQQLIHHFGGYPGYLSHLSFMPERKIGVAVFVNEGLAGYSIMNLFAGFAYDWWLKTPDFEDKYEVKKKKLIETIQKRSKSIIDRETDRAKRTWQLDHPFTFYTGTYSNELLGTVSIQGDADKISLKMGHLQCIATPYTEPNTMRVELVPRSGEVIQFEYDDQKQLIGFTYDDLLFEKGDM